MISLQIRVIIVFGAITFSSAFTQAQTVFEQRTVQSGYQTITYKRLDRPLASVAEAPAEKTQTNEPAPSSQPTERLVEDQAKPQETVTLIGTTYPNGITALRWQSGGAEYRAFSNIDYTVLPGMVQVESDMAQYFILPIVTPSSESAFEAVPSPAEFATGRSEYLVEAHQSDALPNEAFTALDALHELF